jgi:hypothetical protein
MNRKGPLPHAILCFWICLKSVGIVSLNYMEIAKKKYPSEVIP